MRCRRPSRGGEFEPFELDSMAMITHKSPPCARVRGDAARPAASGEFLLVGFPVAAGNPRSAGMAARRCAAGLGRAGAQTLVPSSNIPLADAGSPCGCAAPVRASDDVVSRPGVSGDPMLEDMCGARVLQGRQLGVEPRFVSEIEPTPYGTTVSVQHALYARPPDADEQFVKALGDRSIGAGGSARRHFLKPPSVGWARRAGSAGAPAAEPAARSDG